MKQKAEDHEIIIVGSGLGGLIAGVLLARSKCDVLLLKERRYERFLMKEGYRFVPFSNLSEKCFKRSLLEKICQELGLPLLKEGIRSEEEGKSNLTTKGSPLFQVVLPKARIDISQDPLLLRREWEREFSKEKEAIERLYEELERIRRLLGRMRRGREAWSPFPIRPSWVKRWIPFGRLPSGELRERISGFSKEFKELIRLQMMSWGNLWSDRFPLYLAAYLLSPDEEERWVSPFDLHLIEKRILEVFTSSGGRVEEIEAVERIERKWWKWYVLSLKGETKVVRCRWLLFSSPFHRLPNLSTRERRRLEAFRNRIQPRYVLLPLFLGVDERVVPVGMKELLVSVMHPDSPYEGGNLLLLHVSPKRQSGWAPPGKRALTVESLIPVEKLNGSPPEEHMNGVMRHLEHLFPFLEGYIEFKEWGWGTEALKSWSYSDFLYETNGEPNWGEGILPFRLSRNLYFVGKENFPYLGLEGEVVSGRWVGREILRRVRDRGN